MIPGPDGPVSATYIFDTLQGTIEGYAETGDINSAQIMNSSTGAEYTGLAAGISTMPKLSGLHLRRQRGHEPGNPGLR